MSSAVPVDQANISSKGACPASAVTVDDESGIGEQHESIACVHCSLPVPAGLLDRESKHQFCCSGCRGAYELIHSSGLGSFYTMSKSEHAGQGKPFEESNTGFAEYDEPVFVEKYGRRVADDECSIELSLDGIHCGACVWLLEKLPKICPGVLSSVANWPRRTIRIHWRKDDVRLSQVAATLNRLGYRPGPIQPNAKRDRWQFENRSHLVRIGVAAACAGNNMIISAALYFGMFSHMTASMSALLRVSSCAVGILTLVWPGRVFLKSAVAAIRTRTPHMDLPIALALLVGTLAGLANVVRGTGEIYFDSLSVLIFLLLIGRWIQFRQQSRATDAVELLYRLTPQMARKVVDGKPIDVLVELIERNDLIEVRPGDLFPVDGEVVEGCSSVDESILTGESVSVLKKDGDKVAAGTRNENSVVLIRALAVGRETRLSQIVELVERASSEKPEMVLWANHVGGYFVVAVVLLAMLTFGWWISTSFEIAIDRTIALLIVACPCALALATPLAIAVALGRAANRKIMIKGGDVLQALQKPGRIWLDKTGTITEGNIKVVRWHGSWTWLDFAEALERKSTHPVANAIIEFASAVRTPCRDAFSYFDGEQQQSSRLMRETVAEMQSLEGLGICGVVGESKVLVGSEKLLASNGIRVSRAQRRIAEREIENGLSPCWMAVNDKVVGIAALGDAIRTDAVESVEMLQGQGWNVGILSGDHQNIVDRVARRIGVASEDAKGGVSPEAKLKAVRDSAAEGTVVMIGDGVNDSAALAAAHVGVAVKGGAEASLAAAPVYFANPGLAPVLDLIAISNSTTRTMRTNLAVSLAYNMSFAGLAFAGFINPFVAAILMPVSSISVVALSLRSGRIAKVCQLLE